jgi:hypothetical protein
MAQLLAAAAGGLALGVIAAVLGFAELRHRSRIAGHQPTEADTLGTRTTPIRW